jgi:hypothetical protein
MVETTAGPSCCAYLWKGFASTYSVFTVLSFLTVLTQVTMTYAFDPAGTAERDEQLDDELRAATAMRGVDPTQHGDIPIPPFPPHHLSNVAYSSRLTFTHLRMPGCMCGLLPGRDIRGQVVACVVERTFTHIRDRLGCFLGRMYRSNAARRNISTIFAQAIQSVFCSHFPTEGSISCVKL